MLRFRLQTLVILAAVQVVGLAWLAYERRQIGERRESLAGAQFAVEPQPAATSNNSFWVMMRRIAEAIYLPYTGTDAALAHRAQLTQVGQLSPDCQEVTDPRDRTDSWSNVLW